MQPPIRLVIADDHGLFRQGLKSLLKLHAEVAVVGEAEQVEHIAPLLAQTPCDLLLLDLSMDRSSLDDIPRFAAHSRVVVVTANEHVDDAVAALRRGARAVVFKRFAVDTLMAAIQAVAAGHVWMPPAVQAGLVSGLVEEPSGPLTAREREVIRYVALGLRNAEVARRLFISEPTVKTHLNNIFHKLGIRDRVELTLYAARTGIIGVHERPG